MPLEGAAQDAPVPGKEVGVPIAELGQQPRRALDVGEEKGDRAGGEIGPLDERLVGAARREGFQVLPTAVA